MNYSQKQQDILNGKQPVITKKTALFSGAVILFCILLFVIGMLLVAKDIDNESAALESRLLKEKSSAAVDIDLANALRTSTVNRVIENESIPAYSVSQIRSLDMSKPSGATLSDLKLVTRGNLKGLESAFLKAEQDYGVNCLFVMAIASLESADGTICFRPNNMFGYGNSGFSSKAEGIDVVSRALAQKYLRPGASLYSGKTISDVNKRYAASSTWDDKVASRMASYYATISKNHNAALEKLK